MAAHFTPILIGKSDDRRRVALELALRHRSAGLAASNETLAVLDQGALAARQPTGRSIAVVFCRAGMDPTEIAAIAVCLERAIPVIPVVEKLTDFNKVAPQQVADFNGFELADADEPDAREGDVGELAGLMLESLGLQRPKRKIFISYARADASAVAEQLRQAFLARWYAVFLDTISIRPGAVFQEELMQELADSDVVVLLNSPIIKGRPYVQKEIAFADQAGVGGVQVVWPGETPLSEGAYFSPVLLNTDKARIMCRRVVRLKPAGLMEVVRRVAKLRTDLQEMREEQLVAPIRDYAGHNGWDVVRYPGRHIELRKAGEHIHLNVALGVPTSIDLERTFKEAHPRPPAGRLVYSPLGITNEQAAHLDFLRARLELLFLDPKNSMQWTTLR